MSASNPEGLSHDEGRFNADVEYQVHPLTANDGSKRAVFVENRQTQGLGRVRGGVESRVVISSMAPLENERGEKNG